MGSRLDQYDDLAGLDFAEFDEFINMSMLQEMGVAGLSGAGAVFAITYGLQYVSKLSIFNGVTAVNKSRILSAAGVVLGVGGARALYNINRDAAMGVAGGAIGLSIANLVGTLFTTNPLGAPLGEAPDDASVLSDYDYSTINGLSEANVEAADPAFARLGPSGLSGTMVNTEQLQGYMPYLA